MQQPCNFNIGLKKMGRFIDLPIFKVNKASCVCFMVMEQVQYFSTLNLNLNFKSKLMYHLKTFMFTEMNRSKIYFEFLYVYMIWQKKLERERLWPVHECHWMSNRWLSLARWEKSAYCLHWWVIVSPHFIQIYIQTAVCGALGITWLFIRNKPCAICSTSAPDKEGGTLFCALQAPTRRRLSCWGGGVFGTCQIHHRGPGLAACTAPWQVLVSGEVLLTC